MRSEDVGSGSLFVCSRLNWPGGSSKAGASIVVDQEVLDSQLKTDRFPFPSEGDITLKVRNANYTLGPVILHIGMKPARLFRLIYTKAWPRRSMWLRATLPTRASSTRQALCCISRPERHTARTPRRMDAGYSSSGLNAPRRRLPISATSPLANQKKDTRS